jgi:hypothetical protein
MEPEFSYIDVGRGQHFAVWPASRQGEWPDLEKRSQAAFDKSFGAAAPKEARGLGKKIAARAVFCWAALNEKLIAAEAGIDDRTLDDRTLELAKLGAIRNLDRAPIDSTIEFRLVEAQADKINFGWIRSATDELTEIVSLPRAVVAEIEAAAADRAGLDADIGSGMFVDYWRSLVAA